LDEVINVQEQYYILATSARTDERTRVLKHGETFAVFDRYGDLRNIGIGEYGLYHEGTRHLSRLELRLGHQRPLLLSSTIQKANTLLAADLTNPDVTVDAELVLPKGVLHLFRSKFLWSATCYERLHISNYGMSRLKTSITIHFDADFMDVFEVRGISRARSGQRLEPTIRPDGVRLMYRGLDGVVRRTWVTCEPRPDQVAPSMLTLNLDLGPHESVVYSLELSCESGETSVPLVPQDMAFEASLRASAVSASRRGRIRGSNEQFNEWVSRSFADLDMMTTDTPTGPYPYAGIPWFSTPFGRDGLITAMESLWIDPELARGVLRYLAATQATTTNEVQDAQPGKILHEARQGEMAALGEVPFARYYGSVDATPLFVMLAGAYHQRTGDLALISDLWPSIERALEWIDRYGDLDGDGFIEYSRRSPHGLVNQGWKDSGDAVFHRDGQLATGPVALCEVQGYVYAARRAAVELAGLLGFPQRAAKLDLQAEAIQRDFERQFWCEELGTYALALDGEKRPCEIRTSNAGHCLWTGIASPARAQRLAETLFHQNSFSGWGIRTVAAREARYNPMSYHNGSVWPHDNALIASGLSRYGFKDLALSVLDALFHATLYLDLQRLPELFCGFHRRLGDGPTLYPVACSPQAWSAAAAFMLLQAGLGLTLDAGRRVVTFSHPRLPHWLDRLQIENLSVGDATVDLLAERHPHDVGLTVLRRTGDVTVVHIT